MATAAQILAFREAVQEPDNSGGWTDEKIGAFLDERTDDLGVLDVNLAYSDAWTQKASAVATLVDITENGSSRKNSDLSKNFLSIAETYRGRSLAILAATANRPRTRAIVRP